MKSALLIASPVAELGKPETGGVSSSVLTTKKALELLGVKVSIAAPSGSDQSINISGTLQQSVHNADKAFYPVFPNSVISNQMEYAFQNQFGYDYIINFANDWLPYYLTGFFKNPLFHIANLPSINDTVDFEIKKVSSLFPGQVAAISRAQANSLGIADTCYYLKHAVELENYKFNPKPENQLCWAGRISPEKGLEDAAEAAQRLNMRLAVCGFVQDEAYWQKILSAYSSVIDYKGFVSQDKLQEEIGNSTCLLVTSKWVEAFGYVVIESLATGTPVISYECGGPAEIINHGQTGFLANSIEELCSHIQNLSQLSRQNCRKSAQDNYSIAVMAEQLGEWLKIRTV